MFHPIRVSRQVCVLAIVTLLASLSVTIGLASGTWVTRAPLSVPRYASSAVEMNGEIHVIGGTTTYACSFLASHDVYNPATNTWTVTPEAPMSVPRVGFGAVVLNGLLYAVGGNDRCSSELSSLEAYNPVTNTWSPRASMSTPRSSLGVGVIGGRIFALGGLHPSDGGGIAGMLATVEAYDPATNSWTPQPSLPHGLYNMGVGVIADVLYVAGGSGPSGLTTEVYAFDPAAPGAGWVPKAPMPFARQSAGFSSVVVGGRLYVAGRSHPAPVAEVDIYDPATNTWTTGTPLPANVFYPALAIVNGQVYSFGGISDSSVPLATTFLLEVPPTTTLSLSPPANGNGWNNENVLVTLNATASGTETVTSITYTLSGAQTGSATVAGSSAALTVSEEGTTTVTYHAVGSLGNVEANQVATVRIDRTLPVITPILDQTILADSPAGGTFVFTPTATDMGVSGVVSVTASHSGPFFPTGETTVTLNALDAAGNGALPVTFTVTVTPTGTVVTWNTPEAITYGTPLGGQQLDAAANVPGTFIYEPSTGVLSAGAHTLSVTFTPLDGVHWNAVTTTVALTVNKATPSVHINVGTFRFDGLAHPAAATAAGVNGAPVNGSFDITYSPGGSSPPVEAGNYAVTADFTSTDPNYTNTIGSTGQGATWTSGAPMPYGALGAPMPAGVIDGKLFIPGAMYDPASNTWAGLGPNYPNLPSAAAGVIGGKLYVAVRTSMHVYDPATDMWTAKAEQPGAGVNPNAGVAGVINGKLYVAGGLNLANTLQIDNAWSYDPVGDAWTALAPLPSPRALSGAGVIAGKLYVVGGQDQHGRLTRLDVYDPATDTWTPRAPMPTVREALTVQVVDGILYAFGGYDGDTQPGFSQYPYPKFLNTVEAYDPASNTWTTLDPMPYSHSAAVSGVINGVVYVMGGVGDVVDALAGSGGSGAQPVYDYTSNDIFKANRPLTIVANNPPQFITPTPTALISVPAGSQVTFTARASDPDADDLVTVNVDGSTLPPGSESGTNGPANPADRWFTWTPQSGDVGAHTIQFAAIDNFDASTPLSVTINVTPAPDTTPPTLSPMSNITLQGTASTGGFVNVPLPTATDSGSGVQSVSCDRPSGNFPFGTTTVTCTARDNAGNTSSVSFTVTVGPQTGHYLLTIHMVGLGNPPVTGVVGITPLALLCNVPDASGQCTFQVQAGTALRLNGNAPTPSTPAVFSGGTGPASACATSTCRFVMTGHADVTATLDPAAPVYTTSINLAGDGPGEVYVQNSRCQNYDHDMAHLPTQYSACQTSYAPNSEVFLEAWPPDASRFAGFSNGTNTASVCGMGASCSFLLNDNTSVVATFSALTTIRVAPANDTININQSRQFTANGTYSDLVTQPITGGMGTWRTRASMNQIRFNFAAAAAGGRVYALGGLNGSGPGASFLGSVEAYDPSSNSWTTRQGISPRASLGAATLDDRYIYAVGGSMPGGCPIDRLDTYDTTTDTWTAKAPMPGGPRRNLSAAILGRTLYAIGGELNQCGESSGTPLTRVEAYDVDTSQWTTLADMSTARTAFGVGVVNGIIYAVGGGDAQGDLSTVEAYNPATNTWSPKAPLPGARSLHAVAVMDNILYVVGGNHGGYFNSVFAYDPATNAWSNKAWIPQVEDRVGPNNTIGSVSGQRAELAAAALDGKLYAMGGLVTPGGSPPGSLPAPPVAIVTAFVDTLVWSSSDNTVATIVNQNQSGSPFGLATGQHAGTTIIRARAGTVACDSPPGQCATLAVTDTIATTLPAVTIFGSPMGNPAVTITAGQNVSMTGSNSGSFRDPDQGQTWTATVTYGDGSGQQQLNLGPGNPPNGPTGTFSLNHTYNQSGVYTVTVTVTDNLGGIGTGTLRVTVNPPASQIFLGLPGSAFTQVGNPQWGCGSFSSTQNSAGPWAATVNYGDGGGNQSLPLTTPAPPPGPDNPCVGSSGTPPTGVFSFNHAYTAPGNFQVSVTVTNTATGASKTGSFPIEVSEAGGDDGCALVSTNLVAGNVPFSTVQMSLFDRSTGELLFTENVPLGMRELGEAPQGFYRVEFSVPAGYIITPAHIDFDAICGEAVVLSAQIAAESVDTDGDGIGDNADPDDDGDGVADGSDTFPLDAAESADADGDGTGDNADLDDDNDGTPDTADAFPLDATESVDTDGDGTGNNADADDDGDGALDGSDAFPLNAAESVDTDGDGTGNNADTDDDGDGALDGSDVFPLDATESIDTDGDGIGDNGDADDDNDGFADAVDGCPLVAGPAQGCQAGATIGDLMAKVNASALPPSAMRALSATLGAASKAIERGNATPAQALLRAFMHEVRMLESRGLLTGPVADGLIADAQAIANAMDFLRARGGRP